MRLYVGVAQDVVVKRTIDKNEQRRIAGNLYDREVVVKFEIENFKDKAVVLDISENVRAIRNELCGDNGRDVQWELGKSTDIRGRAGQGKEHLRATAVPRSAAGPRRRRQGREDRSQTPPGHEERVVRKGRPMRRLLILGTMALGTRVPGGHRPSGRKTSIFRPSPPAIPCSLRSTTPKT